MNEVPLYISHHAAAFRPWGVPPHPGGRRLRQMGGLQGYLAHKKTTISMGWVQGFLALKKTTTPLGSP